MLFYGHRSVGPGRAFLAWAAAPSHGEAGRGGLARGKRKEVGGGLLALEGRRRPVASIWWVGVGDMKNNCHKTAHDKRERITIPLIPFPLTWASRFTAVGTTRVGAVLPSLPSVYPPVRGESAGRFRGHANKFWSDCCIQSGLKFRRDNLLRVNPKGPVPLRPERLDIREPRQIIIWRGRRCWSQFGWLFAMDTYFPING